MNATTTHLLRTARLKSAGARCLIVIDRRAFTRACLAHWLTGAWPDMTAWVVADAREALGTRPAAMPVAAVLCATGTLEHDPWLARQVALLRGEYADLPIALLVETDDLQAVEAVVGRLALHGYIPTTSSMDLVSAAMRVIVAGGTYFPRMNHEAERVPGALAPAPARREPKLPPEPIRVAALLSTAPKLTPRERAVLDLLAEGLPNKLIAYRLAMSVSTVKVHVHHLIQKLGARNRTELALRARTSYPSPAVGGEAAE